RVHHIHNHRDLRLESFVHGGCMRFEAVHMTADGARLVQQSLPLFRETRIAPAAIEQAHTELSFQIRQRLADYGLRPPELASGRRKAALFSRRDEGAKLIEGDCVEHELSPKTMDNIE